MKRRAKIMATVAGVSAGAVLAIGALHMPFARPLLMRVGGCPAAFVTPKQVEAAQQQAVKASAGTSKAPSRFALGFTLDRTTVDDVRAWAEAAGVKCDESRETTLVVCKSVPASAVSGAWSDGVADVAFGIAISDHTVISVTTTRNPQSGDAASKNLGAVTAQLASTLGKPKTELGTMDFAAPVIKTALVEYAFSDYLASVTATRMPGRGIIVTEQYLSVRN